jgi:hypothetical protein
LISYDFNLKLTNAQLIPLEILTPVCQLSTFAPMLPLMENLTLSLKIIF